MIFEIRQGDILKIENMKAPVLVVSRNYFNRTEQIIACPVLKNALSDPLHIPIVTQKVDGIVLCEQMKLLDLSIRGYAKLTSVKNEDIMNIADAIQAIFDYYPYGR